MCAHAVHETNWPGWQDEAERRAAAAHDRQRRRCYPCCQTKATEPPSLGMHQQWPWHYMYYCCGRSNHSSCAAWTPSAAAGFGRSGPSSGSAAGRCLSIDWGRRVPSGCLSSSSSSLPSNCYCVPSLEPPPLARVVLGWRYLRRCCTRRRPGGASIRTKAVAGCYRTKPPSMQCQCCCPFRRRSRRRQEETRRMRPCCCRLEETRRTLPEMCRRRSVSLLSLGRLGCCSSSGGRAGRRGA